MKKILSLVLIIFLVGIIISIAIAQRNNNEVIIKSIIVEGNNHLDSIDYMKFANLIGSNYKDLSLRIIKDRIEKHPYVKYADVKYMGGFKVYIKIYEKNFESILIDKGEQYILTEELELLPFLSGLRDINLPIISNISRKDSLKILTQLRNNHDILTASKILSGLKFTSRELYNELSVIDMNYGKDIVVYFKSIDYPVIIGRENEIKKLVYYYSFWENLKGNEINNLINYIDLRYSGHIYLGIQDSLLVGEKKL
ncbi:MAG: FtsQ-type POTRA domain-containing protein [Melioribacter sp.]|nr:FtsQ-type POTRA domain-containing protein [Melioribacter sp.]